MVQKAIQARTSHDEFKEILIKFDLMVRVKAPIFIYLKRWQNQEFLLKCYSILMEHIFIKVEVYSKTAT